MKRWLLISMRTLPSLCDMSILFLSRERDQETILVMKAKKVLGAVGLILLLFVGQLAFEHGFDFIFHPWAYPVLMGPGVLGTWKAEFSMGGVGPVKAVYRFDHQTYRDEGPMLEGNSYHCSPTHQMEESTLGGRVSWLGKEVSIFDSSNYGPWGSPESFVCHYAADRLTCVLDFSRKHSAQMEKLAKRAGLEFQREPSRFTMVRAREGERPEGCPAIQP